jgi:hypothetical protein
MTLEELHKKISISELGSSEQRNLVALYKVLGGNEKFSIVNKEGELEETNFYEKTENRILLLESEWYIYSLSNLLKIDSLLEGKHKVKTYIKVFRNCLELISKKANGKIEMEDYKTKDGFEIYYAVFVTDEKIVENFIETNEEKIFYDLKKELHYLKYKIMEILLVLFEEKLVITRTFQNATFNLDKILLELVEKDKI